MGFVSGIGEDLIEPVEAAANRVLATTFPKVQELVDRTVEQVEARAASLVERSLAASFERVDGTVAMAQARLERSIEKAGLELRDTATHTVEKLDGAVDRRIRHLEDRSLGVVEEAVRRSVEESAKATRLEIEAVVHSLHRLLLGLAIPVPTALYAVLASIHGAPGTELAARSLAVLAATTAGVALFEVLRRNSAGTARARWHEVLLDLAPYAMLGALFAGAVGLAR